MNRASPDPAASAAARLGHQRRARTGIACGVAAYAAWGVLPVYFKLVAAVDPVAIVAHRIVWSMVALAVLVSLLKGWDKVRRAAADPAAIRMLSLTATLIGGNWLLYVYAINSGHILAGSLGYYLNPLANILLGRFILKEKLTKVQWAAVGIAAAGVAVLAAGALGTLWISLTLCFSFATYGLLRKIVAVDALAGLTVETMMLFPLALGWLLLGGAEGRPFFGSGGGTETVLLMSAGIVSTVPLLCFTAAARRLPYSTVGMLQFLAPTLQFLLAVAVYGEPFTRAHAIAFGAIWAALILYTSSLIATRRRATLADCFE